MDSVYSQREAVLERDIVFTSLLPVFHFVVKTKQAAFLQATLWPPFQTAKPNDHGQNDLRLWTKQHYSSLQADFLWYISHQKKDN